jgi:hypothetical protein
LESQVEKKGIKKAQLVLVICAVLVVVLALFSILFYSTLQKQIDAYHDLENQKDSLQNQLNMLSTEYQNYKSRHSYTNTQYNAYVDSHQHSNSEYEEAKFSFYYVKPEEQKLGVYELEDELTGLEWLHPYQEDVFDCSEMSAYLEWHLENDGWNVVICAGDSPFGNGHHAWLLVETSDNKYMPVESTNINIVWWESPYFDNYFEYEHEFETIQDALDYNETDFDWWNT